jgi:hypothetical protein
MNIKNEGDGWFRISRRLYRLPRIESIVRIAPAQWHVKHANIDTPFRIEGGKAAGGSARDWFVDGGSFNGYIACKSFVEAVSMLSGM